jgi:polyhydroxyalkanoate synthesis regulator protein
MAGRVLQTDFKRIGVSGPTSDGRVVDPSWIDEMAETYDPEKTFKALIWPDHMRYMNYGSVEALKATTGVDGRRELWAVLAPNMSYQADNKFDRRLFTSMEITFDFAKSGKAYLTGLGATDEPASLGTSEIKFNKHAEAAGMVLSGFIESETKTFTEQQPSTLLDQIKSLFTNQPEDAEMADKAALEALKTELAAVKEMLSKLPAQPETDKPADKTEDQFSALIARLDALEAKFSANPAPAAANSPAGDAVTELTAKFDALAAKLDDALKEHPGTDSGEHFGANDDNKHYI